MRERGEEVLDSEANNDGMRNGVLFWMQRLLLVGFLAILIHDNDRGHLCSLGPVSIQKILVILMLLILTFKVLL